MRRLINGVLLTRCCFLCSNRTIIEAIRAGLVPNTIFLSSSALDGPLGSDLQREIENNDAVKSVVWRLPEHMIARLSAVETCQGVVGIFRVTRQSELPPDMNIGLVCDGISDPGNLGTLIRSARGLGIDAVVCTGSGSTDPYGPKCLRSSMGTAIQQPLVETSWSHLQVIFPCAKICSI